MLVLSRKVGETLVISDNIRLTIVSLGAGRVKIGIEAPREIAVHREELVADAIPAPDVIVENAVAVHNRLAGKFPPPVVATTASLTGSSPPTAEQRLAKWKRKPR